MSDSQVSNGATGLNQSQSAVKTSEMNSLFGFKHWFSQMSLASHKVKVAKLFNDILEAGKLQTQAD